MQFKLEKNYTGLLRASASLSQVVFFANSSFGSQKSGWFFQLVIQEKKTNPSETSNWTQV